MKILLFIATFLFLDTIAFSQTYSVIKGSVYLVSSFGGVRGRANTSTDSDEFNSGKQVHLTEPWGFNTIKDSSRVHMFFSSKLHVWLGGKTTLWVDNFEQFSDKDVNGKLLPDDGGFIASFRFFGKADFKVEKLSEDGYFNIMTNWASLEAKSKHFYVETDEIWTVVECYDGTIVFTNSIDTKEETILTEGNYATVSGKNGDVNLSVKIYPLTEIRKSRAKGRIIEEGVPKWELSSTEPKSP